MNETSKSVDRRVNNYKFQKYFTGYGIDIGCGPDNLGQHKDIFPGMIDVRGWDLVDGDAQYMESAGNDTYDFIHSSHCLEHLLDPYIALSNWIRICKPNGYLVITIPDEDLYEQGKWPSTFNTDHKHTFTIGKTNSWSPVSTNVFDLLNKFSFQIETQSIELINDYYIFDIDRKDQCWTKAECAIELVLRKRTTIEQEKKGRYPLF
jgi:predicted SAM-dependent methyltransferase